MTGWQEICNKFFILSIRRDYQVYQEVYSLCHSLDCIVWRNLVGISHTRAEAKVVAKEFEYQDGSDDKDGMFARPGKIKDALE